MFKSLLLLSVGLASSAFAAPKLQNSDFATAAQITGAGGVTSQLLNTSKIFDSTNAQLLDTTIASKVDGQASSVDSEIALFSGTGGKIIKRATGTGVVHATSGVYSTASVNLATEVTGTLPIGNGGTGQTTQTSAFNGLDPLTTKGDLVVHNGTDSIRLPVGTNGQILEADSTQAAGVKWAAAAAGSGRAFFSAKITMSSSTSCAVTTQDSSNWISSIANTNVGECTITVAGGIFASTPCCVAANAGTSTTLSRITQPNPTSTTNIVVNSRNTANGGDDGVYHLICGVFN